MVAGFLYRLQTTLEICKRPMQNGSTVAGAIEACAGLGLGMLMGALGAGIVFGNRALIVTEHIDSETLFGVQVRMCPGAVIYAHKHQHRIERYRCKGVSGHS